MLSGRIHTWLVRKWVGEQYGWRKGKQWDRDPSQKRKRKIKPVLKKYITFTYLYGIVSVKIILISNIKKEKYFIQLFKTFQ